MGSPEKMNPQTRQCAACDAGKNEAAGTDHADHLLQSRDRMRKMLQNVSGHDNVKAVVGVRKLLGVCLVQYHVEADVS